MIYLRALWQKYRMRFIILYQQYNALSWQLPQLRVGVSQRQRNKARNNTNLNDLLSIILVTSKNLQKLMHFMEDCEWVSTFQPSSYFLKMSYFLTGFANFQLFSTVGVFCFHFTCWLLWKTILLTLSSYQNVTSIQLSLLIFS